MSNEPMIYRFPDTPQLGDLSLDVRVSDGRIHYSAKGRGWLRRLRPLAAIAGYTVYLNRKKPIRTIGDQYVYSLHIPPVPGTAHARNLDGTLNERFFGVRRPMAATLALTDHCQCFCGHCSAAMRSTERPELTTSEWKRVIDECVRLGVQLVTFTGGEPLLRPDLEELVASVPSDLAVPTFFSNGLALTEQRLRSLKDAGLYAIQLSLDSPDPDAHDEMRGVHGVFEAVETAARMAVDAGVPVGISTYASNESVDERRLTKLAEVAAEWGVCEISVFDAIRTGRLLHAPRPLLDRSHRLRLLLESRGVNRRYSPRLRVITQTWTNLGLGITRSIGCLAAHFQVHVSARGEFMPCDFTPLSFGNVREESVSDLWAKLTSHPAYRRHAIKCRMQNSEFRAKYIEPIPEGAPLPYPVAGLSEAGRAGDQATEPNE